MFYNATIEDYHTFGCIFQIVAFMPEYIENENPCHPPLGPLWPLPSRGATRSQMQRPIGDASVWVGTRDAPGEQIARGEM